MVFSMCIHVGVSCCCTPIYINTGLCVYGRKTSWLFGVQANAQEKFLRIKHAYTTLINSESRRNYGSDRPASGYSGQTNQKGNTQVEEDLYGLGNKTLTKSCNNTMYL